MSFECLCLIKVRKLMIFTRLVFYIKNINGYEKKYSHLIQNEKLYKTNIE